MSKGSRPRPCNKGKFDAEYERIFGKKRLNVWKDSPAEGEPDGIQGNTGDGASDSADGGQAASVPEKPGGETDSQAEELVASSRHGTRRTTRAKRPPDTEYWTYSRHRGEYICPCVVGHGLHPHGCCGKECCKRDDFPLRKVDGDAKETPKEDV